MRTVYANVNSVSVPVGAHLCEAPARPASDDVNRHADLDAGAAAAAADQPAGSVNNQIREQGAKQRPARVFQKTQQHTAAGEHMNALEVGAFASGDGNEQPTRKKRMHSGVKVDMEEI